MSNLIDLEFFSTTSNSTLRIIDHYMQDSATFWLCQDINVDSTFFIIHDDEVVAELEDTKE